MSRNRAARRREGALATLEAVDGFAPMRNGMRRMAQKLGHWAGIPMPLQDMSLVMEPTFPGAQGLAAIGPEPKQLEPLPADVKQRSEFYSFVRKAWIVIWEEGGKLHWSDYHGTNRMSLALLTMGASDAWGIEQESNAVHTLGTLVRHRQFKQYMLTGMFMETSRRSGITYIFRRLRPTLAITLKEEEARILAALCLHPIAYYAGSWAGGMCPTDDVIAHLMLMRGDEHMLWRRANQHPPHAPEAGL
jgi:hypothetical protein